MDEVIDNYVSVIVNDLVIINSAEASPDETQENEELELLATVRHVQAARAQQKLYNLKVTQCRLLIDSSVDSAKVETLVVDYGQKMELPWFSEAQSGDTYYYSPLTVNNLGIVDYYNDILIAYVYHEGRKVEVTLQV